MRYLGVKVHLWLLTVYLYLVILTEEKTNWDTPKKKLSTVIRFIEIFLPFRRRFSPSESDSPVSWTAVHKIRKVARSDTVIVIIWALFWIKSK